MAQNLGKKVKKWFIKKLTTIDLMPLMLTTVGVMFVLNNTFFSMLGMLIPNIVMACITALFTAILIYQLSKKRTGPNPNQYTQGGSDSTSTTTPPRSGFSQNGAASQAAPKQAPKAKDGKSKSRLILEVIVGVAITAYMALQAFSGVLPATLVTPIINTALITVAIPGIIMTIINANERKGASDQPKRTFLYSVIFSTMIATAALNITGWATQIKELSTAGKALAIILSAAAIAYFIYSAVRLIQNKGGVDGAINSATSAATAAAQQMAKRPGIEQEVFKAFATADTAPRGGSQSTTRGLRH